MELTGNQQRLILDGDLDIEDGAFDISRLPKSSRPTLDVRFEENEQDSDETQNTFSEMKLRIRSDGRIKLRGRGLNAQLGLDTQIRGSLSDPQLTGTAEIVRGRFEFAGKRFEFVDSQVKLQHDIMRSVLDITAQRETSELTAKIKVTGTLRNPDIALTGEPDLPEDQVLSYVLFGRSPTQLTGLETARLALALAQMSGGGGFDLLGG